MWRLSRATVIDTVCGSGFGLLIGGVALGVYSRVAAATMHLGDRNRESEIQGLPEQVGNTALVLGGVVLVVVATVTATRLPRRKPWAWRTDPVIGWAVALVLLVGAAVFFGNDYWAKYTELRTEYPYFPRMSTAMAAFALVMVGTACIAAGMMAPGRAADRKAADWLRLVVRAGLVPAIVVSAVAIWAGEDSWNIDHVTADRVAVPPVPERLGTERYRVQIPLKDSSEVPYNGAGFEVVAAGAGFVVSGHAGLTAYDGVTGVERWHYRRTEQSGEVVPYSTGTLKSVGEDVVIAAWHHAGWQGFDATTGEVLWTDSEFARDSKSVDWSWLPVTSSTLALANPTQLAGYDPRTGVRRWLIDTAHPSCPVAERNSWTHSIEDVGVGAVLYRARQCVADDLSWWNVMATDGKTGAVLASNDVAHNTLPADRSAGVSNMTVRRLGDSLVLNWQDRVSSEYRAVFVADPTDLDSPTVHSEDTYPTDISPTGDLLINESLRAATYLVNPDTGIRRFQFDNVHSPADPEYRAFLDQEIIELAWRSVSGTRQRSLRAWSSTDGSLVGEQVIADCGDVQEMVAVRPVPGALLVLCSTGESSNLRERGSSQSGV